MSTNIGYGQNELNVFGLNRKIDRRFIDVRSNTVLLKRRNRYQRPLALDDDFGGFPKCSNFTSEQTFFRPNPILNGQFSIPIVNTLLYEFSDAHSGNIAHRTCLWTFFLIPDFSVLIIIIIFFLNYFNKKKKTLYGIVSN